MIYRRATAPRLFLGVIAGVLLGLFALALATAWRPRLHNAYLWYYIESCEAAEGLLPSDKIANFGFDAGGWSVIGDNQRKRAFVECVRNELSLQTRTDNSEPHPTLVVSWHSAMVSPKVHVSYSAPNGDLPTPRLDQISKTSSTHAGTNSPAGPCRDSSKKWPPSLGSKFSSSVAAPAAAASCTKPAAG